MNKTVYVKANFKPRYINRNVEVPTGERGVFGGQKTRMDTETVQDGWSTNEIDGARLQQDTQAAADKLNAEGFDVVSLMPVESGQFNYNKQVVSNGVAAYGYGYGYSYTEGIVILAKKVR